MPYRELNFDGHNLTLAMSEVKDLFRMHFEHGCRNIASCLSAKLETGYRMDSKAALKTS
jgi:hypothetical protein